MKMLSFMGRRFYSFSDFYFRVILYIRMNIRRDGFFHKRYYLRPFVKQIIDHFGDAELVGAEIGVWRGWNSKLILKNLNMAQLYMIDPYDMGGGKAGCDYDKRVAWDNLLYWVEEKGNANFVYKKSLDVDFSKDMFDFVYLDGEHKYSTVFAELRKYYGYIVPGGLLGGHDIDQVQVAMAVVDFCKEYGLEYSMQDRDFWIWKPISGEVK